MMVVNTAQERSAVEYGDLARRAGWEIENVHWMRKDCAEIGLMWWEFNQFFVFFWFQLKLFFGYYY